MRAADTNHPYGRSHGHPDSETLALSALVWTLGSPSRAERLLALTGLDADELRARAGDPALLAEVIGFLASYEPDLIACAEALGVTPITLAAAGRDLSGESLS